MDNIDFTRVHKDDLDALCRLFDRLVFANEVLSKQVLDLEDFLIEVTCIKDRKKLISKNLIEK